jgi:SAM-dependent methyltransferase
MSTILEYSDLNTLHGHILTAVPKGVTVLDVGAGLAKYHELLQRNGNLVTLIDAHKPYLDDRAAKFPEFKLIHGEAIDELGKLLADASWQYDYGFDVALAIDFVEHLTPEDAQLVIKLMQGVARRVVLFVPEGNHPQDHDGYEMGADHWQTHRSTWHAEDLEALGFKVSRWLDFHSWTRGRTDPGALWATWEATR